MIRDSKERVPYKMIIYVCYGNCTLIVRKSNNVFAGRWDTFWILSTIEGIFMLKKQ